MKKIFSAFIFLFYVTLGSAFSQYYVTGQDPASLKWKQIKTEHFKIIFPESFSGEAIRYANLLEKSYLNVLSLYPETRVKIPVIIHNYSMQSNGYVSWAPKRIELYPLPGQKNDPGDPSQLLIMHEVTHVAQMSSLNRGFTRAMSYLLGEQAIGLAAASLPSWSLEGDAVYAETLFSNSGRGRSLSFMQGARTLALSEQGMYDYSKMLFGSYRDFTPDHYVFGYAMMNYLRSHEPGFWEKNMAYTGRNSYKILPLNIMLRKELNLNKNKLFSITFDSLKYSWSEAERDYHFNKYGVLNHDKDGEYENYNSPFLTQKGDVVALKTSLSKPQHFVLIDTISHTEKTLLTPGYIQPSVFSYSSYRVVWAENHPDPRWENRDYSVIKTLDINSGKARQLTFRTRFTSPAISPDGESIVAVNTTPELKSSLVVLYASSGVVKDEISAPEDVLLQRPEWGSDNNTIIAVSLSDDGEGVLRYDLSQKRWEYLIDPSHTNITEAKLSGDNLLLLLQDKNAENVYCKLSDGSLKQITHSRFGISSFSNSPDNLLFSDYSGDGLNVSLSSINTSYDSTNHLSLNSLLFHSKDSLITSSTESDSYSIIPYKPVGHLFRFHSWAPLYFNIDELVNDPESVKPGFTLLSQNDLSTFISSIGYEYSEGIHTFHTDFTYQGLYPIIKAGISYGKPYLFKTSDNTTSDSDLMNVTNVNLDISLPLSFSYSKFNQFVMPAIYINYEAVSFHTIETLHYKNTFITSRIYFSNTFRKAYRDIYPRWGQIIDIHAKFALWENGVYQPLRGFRSVFFLPGILRNHSTMIRLGYETQLPLRKGLFGNQNSFPRGYDGMVSSELSSLSFDYTLPIFYPDLSAGSILYLKRIRGVGYYDLSSSNGTYYYDENKYYSNKKYFSSMGGELMADFYVLRFPYEISAGFRTGYITPAYKPFVEGVFSVNIYGTTLGRNR